MRVCLTILACLVVTGCGNARWTSIARPHTFADTSVQNGNDGVEATVVSGNSIIIDAKQRAIIAQYNKDRQAVAVCAEPSPDAVAALSSALSGSLGGNFLGNREAEAKFSAAFSEAVGTLGKRNATIQLLRDALYRQCEAYANGAILNSEYSSASRRYIDAMVALLAIEQLTNGKEATGKLINGDKTGEYPRATAKSVDEIKTGSQQSAELQSGNGVTATATTGDTTGSKGTGGTKAEARAQMPGTLIPDADVDSPGMLNERVAIEVRTMVEAFFRKGIVSECLALFQTPPDFAKIAGSEGIAEKAYSDFVDARFDTYRKCNDIIAADAKSAQAKAEQEQATADALRRSAELPPSGFEKLKQQLPAH